MALTRAGGDDGLDIDESEDGSIWLNVVELELQRQHGRWHRPRRVGRRRPAHHARAGGGLGNTDSGISADEGGGGNYEAKFVLVTADENEDKGADMTEAGDGDFDGRAVTSSFSVNADDGIAVEQLDAGSGVLELVNVTIEGNGNQRIDADGVDVIEIGPSS